MKNKRTTIQAIADELGLSKSTVSRALGDHPDITEKTKRIVKETAILSGYQPNVFAQNFSKNRTNIIGIVVPDIERPYYASFISGVQERATQHKFFIVTCQSKDSFITEINNLQTLVGLGVDALIISHSKETSHFTEIKKVLNNGTPLLAIDRELENIQSHFVTNDSFIAGFLIGEHLGENGYKNIAIIAGPEQLKMSNLRVEGCLEGLKTAGIEVSGNNLFYCNFDRERELSVVSNLLLRTERPDAIFCIYDRGATAVLKFLQKRNIKIPEEIAVAGCGNDPISAYLNPRLTTIDQQPHKLGELAAEILINEIISKSTAEPIRQVLRPKLLARESTIKKIQS